MRSNYCRMCRVVRTLCAKLAVVPDPLVPQVCTAVLYEAWRLNLFRPSADGADGV
jgi:hypothetical protein